jgi:hypothetical protein
MATISTAVVVLLVVGSLTIEFVRLIRSTESRGQYLATVKAVRWWMVPAGITQLAVVLGVVYALTSVAPVLWFGWWALLGNSGANIVLGQTGRDGFWWQLAALAIPISLMVLMPVLAYLEEALFRVQCEDDGWARRLIKALLFGMMHWVVGVPIAAGLALTVSGLYFQQTYLAAFRRPYPIAPGGPGYEPEAWQAHWRERDIVAAENRRLIEQWVADRPKREAEEDRRLDELRSRALAKSAAAHAVSNWMVLGTLIVWLTAAM